nr:MAG TPA: hypothetical protein [Caudoviricetes sp.]
MQTKPINDTIKSNKFADGAYNRSGIPAYYTSCFDAQIGRHNRTAPWHNSNDGLSHSESLIYLVFHPIVIERIHTTDNKDDLCSLDFGGNSLRDFMGRCVGAGKCKGLFFWSRVVIIRKPRRRVQETHKAVIFIAVSPRMTDKNAIIVQSRHLIHPFLFRRIL